MTLAEQALGPAGVADGALGAALHAPRAGSRPDSLSPSERALARPSPALARPASTSSSSSSSLRGALGRRSRGSVIDIERQRPELGAQRLQPRLELGLAVGEGRGAQADPLLLAAQLRQHPPRLGALAVAGGEALLGVTPLRR